MLAYRLVVGNVFRALADPTRRVVLDEPRERDGVLVDDQHKALRFCTEVLGFVKNTEIPLGGTAARYDIVARGGTAQQARSVLQLAGLLPDQPTDVPPPGAAGANP